MTRLSRDAAPAADRQGPDRPDSGQIVEDLLGRWPQTAPVFLKLRMACVGCDMSGFETVAEVAESYGIAVDRLLEELAAAIEGRESAEETR